MISEIIRGLAIVFLGISTASILVLALDAVAPQINKPSQAKQDCDARGGVWLGREAACVAPPPPKAKP